MSKEKTREIKVWVQKEILTDKESRSRNIRPMVCPVQGNIELCADYFVEATLLIKEPEKTVNISESQFDEAWEDTRSCGYVTPETSVKKLKEKLFGSET